MGKPPPIGQQIAGQTVIVGIDPTILLLRRWVGVGALADAVRIHRAADGDCAARAGVATESLSNTLSTQTFNGSDFCYCVVNGNSSDG